jgi:pimeloyl-ACP methyl ester carboxylesterase
MCTNTPTLRTFPVRKSVIAALLAAGAIAALAPVLATTASATGDPLGQHLRQQPASATGDPLGQYVRQKPAWHRCAKTMPTTYQCATIKVPLDYSRPDGKKLDLAISKMTTSTKKERRGVLLLNPGGPGTDGLSMPKDTADILPKSVTSKYDLVGFDPRGVGRSSPVSCGLTPEEQNRERPYRAEAFVQDVKWARTVAEKCDAKQGDKLRHITTRNTARDMDVIRAVLGEKKISYLGVSYGTYLGAVYTQMFPQRADRFVLDSAADPTRIWRGTFQLWAQGAEPAFTRWTQWTADRNSTYKLGGTAEAVRKTFYDLVAQADRKPIRFNGTALTGDDIRSQSRVGFFYLRDAAEWISKVNKAATRRAPSAGQNLEAPTQAAPSFGPAVPEDNEGAAFFSIACADTRDWPRDPEQYRRDAIRDKAKYPVYGHFASNIKPCAFWKKQGTEPATRVDNKVAALILQYEWDPQTPLTSGQGMRRAMKGAKMVTVTGGVGHGVYGNLSCADKIATAYLTTGKLPAKDMTCKDRTATP